jgi:hypothetical protein
MDFNIDLTADGENGFPLELRYPALASSALIVCKVRR